MKLEFLELALIFRAKDLAVPVDLKDDDLFIEIRPTLISLLNDDSTEVIYFGMAPDNTADGQDELLLEGTFFRIICNEKYLGIDLESDINEIKQAFKHLVEQNKPFWTTTIVEQGFVTTETTIELLYRDVF